MLDMKSSRWFPDEGGARKRLVLRRRSVRRRRRRPTPRSLRRHQGGAAHAAVENRAGPSRVRQRLHRLRPSHGLQHLAGQALAHHLVRRQAGHRQQLRDVRLHPLLAHLCRCRVVLCLDERFGPLFFFWGGGALHCTAAPGLIP